jgi:hypothetical protein
MRRVLSLGDFLPEANSPGDGQRELGTARKTFRISSRHFYNGGRTALYVSPFVPLLIRFSRKTCQIAGEKWPLP